MSYYGLLLLIFLVPPWSTAYKMVLFVPDIANSQVIFNTRVAETLAKAGHDVTMVMFSGYDDRDSSDVKIMKDIHIHRVNASFGMKRKELEEQQQKVIFKDLPMWDSRLRNQISRMTILLTKMCRKVVENKEFLNWLVAQKFDLAFSHIYDVCHIGLIHYAKIPSWIWLNSGGLMDFVAYHLGVPTVPSYVPPMIMESTDEMDFVQRMKSFIGHSITPSIWKKLISDPETKIFRELVDPNFPDIVDIAKTCPLVMVNSNELYELTRPSLAKVINIGGVGIQMKDAKPLSKEFQKIVDNCEGLVVFSFGSVTPSHRMPAEWKKAFLEAFSRFSKLNFVLRYEGTDLNDQLPKNVYLFKWLPQADLLRHPKTVAFVSHGGYNSLQEVITAGVPLITVALFGDQPRNAKLAERHRFAINIRKGDLSADTVAEALQRLLTDKSYSQNVKRLSEMVKRKPVSPDHLLVAWAEFVAEFKTLENLVPAGTKLNFIQYHSLDVIVFLLTILTVALFIIWRLLKFILLKLYALLFRARKEKQM
uniref:glucuronosyltransferase n=1 Tax=Haemonchus contortus TaxID=6289 RepID=A0A7I4YNP2_HAECO